MKKANGIKKKINTLMLCILVTICANAQFYEPPFYIPMDTKYKVLDSAKLKITYKLIYLKDSDRPNDKYTDIETLLIGEKMSKYFSTSYADYNDEIHKALKSRRYTSAIPNAPAASLGIEIYKKFAKNEMTVVDLRTRLHNDFLYTESIPIINWSISNVTSTIASHTCQKATAEFRGRKYEVWFTSEIPINAGPWKFGGLPGLILKVTDDKQHYSFECIGIEQLSKKESIIMYDLSYKRTNREAYNKLCKSYHIDIVPFAKMQGGAVFSIEKRGEVKSKRVPYNPVELK
jgi:GLPGLI family protein